MSKQIEEEETSVWKEQNFIKHLSISEDALIALQEYVWDMLDSLWQQYSDADVNRDVEDKEFKELFIATFRDKFRDTNMDLQVLELFALYEYSRWV